MGLYLSRTLPTLFLALFTSVPDPQCFGTVRTRTSLISSVGKQDDIKLKFLCNLFVIIAYCRYRYIYITVNKRHNTVEDFSSIIYVDCRIQEAQQVTR
jgi:hypothetical protein